MTILTSQHLHCPGVHAHESPHLQFALPHFGIAADWPHLQSTQVQLGSFCPAVHLHPGPQGQLATPPASVACLVDGQEVHKPPLLLSDILESRNAKKKVKYLTNAQ